MVWYCKKRKESPYAEKTIEPRHISITVNTHEEEVMISTKKDFRGSYNTTLDWSAETAADESIPNTRRLFVWLRQWIKDIMG